MSDSLILQKPAGHPQQLILLFHGVGAGPQDMVPLGQRLAREFPQAFIVSVRSPQGCDFSAGYQWFSVREVDDDNRAARVAAALPAFIHQVRLWQQASGASVESTALVGFSQGAIMVLEAAQAEPHLAGRVIAFAGRYARLPTAAPERTTLHLFHGKHDDVIHYSHTVHAAERLVQLGADLTADVVPFTGHGISDELQDLLVERLRGHIPKHVWEEAMRNAPE
jgi:phospholipase/carboxylesterase